VLVFLSYIRVTLGHFDKTFSTLRVRSFKRTNVDNWKLPTRLAYWCILCERCKRLLHLKVKHCGVQLHVGDSVTLSTEKFLCKQIPGLYHITKAGNPLQNVRPIRLRCSVAATQCLRTSLKHKPLHTFTTNSNTLAFRVIA